MSPTCFRDPAAFDELGRKLFRQLAAATPGSTSAASGLPSTGEEVYSITMLLGEHRIATAKRKCQAAVASASHGPSRAAWRSPAMASIPYSFRPTWRQHGSLASSSRRSIAIKSCANCVRRLVWRGQSLLAVRRSPASILSPAATCSST